MLCQLANQQPAQYELTQLQQVLLTMQKSADISHLKTNQPIPDQGEIKAKNRNKQNQSETKCKQTLISKTPSASLIN